MRHLTRAGLALVLGLALTFGVGVRAEDGADAVPMDTKPVADHGFPWLCFAVTIAALGALYAFVRRRELAVESQLKRGGAPPVPWYCRTCARDVIGPECPRCHAANPFLKPD